jgi:alkylated DNA nucleotide flippase Atl1
VSRVVLTIGHSNRSFYEVLAMLRANDVTHLVDVRAFPSSRTFPQWNRDAIEAALPGDLDYRWLPQLGGRRHTPAGISTENGAWRVKAFRDYADHMATDEFAQGLAVLLDLAAHGRPAIMCSEAVPWRCHRRLITDALLVAGAAVSHIMSPTSTRPAQLNETAVVAGGRITYPPPDDGPDLTGRVRDQVATIPAGRVATYGDLADVLGVHPRQVGRAVSLLDVAVPWWRVVRADGTPSSCRDGRAVELLESEETPMKRSRIDLSLARHGWE